MSNLRSPYDQGLHDPHAIAALVRMQEERRTNQNAADQKASDDFQLDCLLLEFKQQRSARKNLRDSLTVIRGRKLL